MYRISFWLLSCLPLVLMPSPAAAVHKGKCCVTCPKCKYCCELNVEEVKEQKHCWKIECEEICVPRIVFPWQNRHLGCCKTGRCATSRSCTGECCGRTCCGSAGGKCCKTNHNGARVKTVRKLVKHDYECPACEYSWTPKKVCARGCYGSCNCAARGEDADDHADHAEGDDEHDVPAAPSEVEEARMEVQPPVAKPAEVAEPTAAEPIAAEPTAAEPIAGEPTVAEPIAGEPTVAEPTAAEPRTRPVSKKVRDPIPTAPQPKVKVPSSYDPFDRPAIFDGFGKRSVRFAPDSASRKVVSRY